MVSKKRLQFHPLSEVYRLMEEDELADLAADIKENGLLEPIVLYEGKVLDGRNRLLACEKAKVEPTTTNWDGEGGSPQAFVLSKHTRRSVTAGQHAMAVARMYPDGGGRGKKDPAKMRAENVLISSTYLKQARAVLKEAPDLAHSVTTGPTTLSAAYAELKERRAQARSEHAMLIRLREQAADLAELVGEGRMSLSEALGALRQREEDMRQRERIVADSLYGIAQGWSHLVGLESDPARDGALEILDTKTRKRILEIQTWARKTK